MSSRVYIVIPAYNEGPVIGDVVRPLVDMGYSVVVVDDGSTDATQEALCRLRVHVLRHPVNLGQGAALQTGVTYALRRGAQAVVHFDADGQHVPENVPALLAPVLSGRVDVALGSRFLDPAHLSEIPRPKRVLLRFGAWFTGLTSGIWLTDTHNGIRAFSADAARRITITENRMAHASQILDLVKRNGLRYGEVPVRIRYTDYSMSKGQSVLNAINIVIDVFLRRVLK